MNILLGSFALVGIGFFISEIQSMVYDRKREKREREKAEQDKEYHEAMTSSKAKRNARPRTSLRMISGSAS